jgi:hypothetical protein
MSSEEKRESGDVAPSMKPEEIPNLQDYKGKESTNINACQSTLTAVLDD